MARGRKSSLRLGLSPEEREPRARWQRSTPITAGRARRGKIILLLAMGHSPSDLAPSAGVQRAVVRKWAQRLLAQRLDGLADAPGRGAKGGFPPGSRDSRRAPGLRAPGCAGPQSLPVGLCHTGAPTERGGAC